MPWKPRKWLAVLLAFIFAPLALLYVGRPRWAFFYFVLLLPLVALQLWLMLQGSAWPPVLLATLIALVHAWRVAAHAPSTVERPFYTRWFGLAGVFLSVVLALMLFRAYAYEPFRVPSDSMYPEIPVGSFVMVRKWGYGHYSAFGVPLGRGGVSGPLDRNEVYVFEYPNDRRYDYLKRLIGLPGDRVAYKNKKLVVNGHALRYETLGRSGDVQMLSEEGYRIVLFGEIPDTDYEATVEPGRLLFLGDNRDNSLDSRYFGTVPFDHLIGKVVMVFKPDDWASRPPHGRRQAN